MSKTLFLMFVCCFASPAWSEPPTRFFVRGDLTQDGALDLSDAFATLDFLFVGQSRSPDCLDSADCNDDGALDLSDPIQLFSVLFGSATALAPPSAECGSDPTPDSLNCDSYAPCTADLSNLVAVGDSLMAGFTSGYLHEDYQPSGLASLIANQAGRDLPLPLIADPGLPNLLTITNPGFPPDVAPLPGVTTGRVDPTLQPRNLAVPGQDVCEALTTLPDPSLSVIDDLILGLPGLNQGIARTQIEWAEELDPTTILVWIGSNDVLEAARGADATLLTDVASFEADFTEIIDRLAATGATLVVANLPDSTVIPYLIPVEVLGFLLQIPDDEVYNTLDVGPGDRLVVLALTKALNILMGSPDLLEPADVLTAAESAEIQARTDTFNALIATEADRVGAALVDTNQLLNQISVTGLAVGGQVYTTALFDGIFGFDGLHPTPTAYGRVANEFIEVMNGAFGTELSPVDLELIGASDPFLPAPP